jgi:Leucine-rich repeat (LRR) protein
MAGVHVSNRKKDGGCDAEEANTFIDFSYMDLDECETSMNMALASCDRFGVERILINNNSIRALSSNIYQFRNLVMLNVSSNRLNLITDEIFMLNKLKVFIGSDNLFNDMSLPKNFSDHLKSLEVINLNGNQFKNFPYQLLQMETLQEIHLGANLIETLPKDYENLYNLEVLYLGMFTWILS